MPQPQAQPRSDSDPRISIERALTTIRREQFDPREHHDDFTRGWNACARHLAGRLRLELALWELAFADAQDLRPVLEFDLGGEGG